MKLERLAEVLDLYQFSLGSIGYCVDQMRMTLDELGNQAAVDRADTAKKKYERARSLQYDWDQQKKEDPLERQGTTRLDNKIDQTLSAILQGAEVYAALEDGAAKKQLADEFVEQLFPSGVFPITSKSFDDQHAAVNELIERLDADFSTHVDELNLADHVDRLRELNTEFGEKLEPAREGVSYDEVESGRVAAEDAFHALVVKVLSDYTDDFDTLNRVIKPLLEQTERTRRHIAHRGNIPEVDPETGEPTETIGTGSSGNPSGGGSGSSSSPSGGSSGVGGSSTSSGSSSGGGATNSSSGTSSSGGSSRSSSSTSSTGSSSTA